MNYNAHSINCGKRAMDKSTPFTHPPDGYKPDKCYKCIHKDKEIERLQNGFMELCTALENQLGSGTPTEWVSRIEGLTNICEYARNEIKDQRAEIERLKDLLSQSKLTTSNVLADNNRLRSALERIAFYYCVDGQENGIDALNMKEIAREVLQEVGGE